MSSNLALLTFILTTVLYQPCEMNAPSSSKSSEYMLTSGYTDILRFQLPSGRLEKILLTNLTYMDGMEFDTKRNCFFIKYHDSIERRCLDQEKPPVELASYGINGVSTLAYDWLTDLLYFADTRGKIVALATTEAAAEEEDYFMRRTIVITGPTTYTSGLAVHPPLGYLYWTQHGDWKAYSFNASVYRANLDGSNVQLLMRRPQVAKPIDVTIDYANDRLYWIDELISYIGSCDLNGDDFRIDVEFETKPTTSYQISVLNDVIYWLQSPYNFNRNETIIAYDSRTKTNTTVVLSTERPVDFRVYGAASQSGTNACNDGTHNCTHLCVGAPGEKFRCLCPDGMNMTDAGQCECLHGGAKECFLRAPMCVGDDFQCISDGKCIRSYSRCDDVNDCSDRSDEEHCSGRLINNCQTNEFRCSSDLCIPARFVCDDFQDCPNGLDEIRCAVAPSFISMGSIIVIASVVILIAGTAILVYILKKNYTCVLRNPAISFS